MPTKYTDSAEAVSFVVNCETQAKVDKYWDRLSEDGQKMET